VKRATVCIADLQQRVTARRKRRAELHRRKRLFSRELVRPTTAPAPTPTQARPRGRRAKLAGCWRCSSAQIGATRLQAVASMPHKACLLPPQTEEKFRVRVSCLFRRCPEIHDCVCARSEGERAEGPQRQRAGRMGIGANSTDPAAVTVHGTNPQVRARLRAR
jgi:hypothetical protein